MSSMAIATLGDLIDHGYSLRVNCSCGRSEWMNLEKVAKVAGRNQSWLADDLVPKLRCDRCGRKGEQWIRLHGPNVDGTPVSQGGR